VHQQFRERDVGSFSFPLAKEDKDMRLEVTAVFSGREACGPFLDNSEMNAERSAPWRSRRLHVR
jgi:hypothetical protein